MSYNEKLRCDNLTTNHEGAQAWCMTPEWELYSTVVTTMGVEDKFYERGEDRVRRIADLTRKVQPEFVAQLAIYAREVMHLRSVPMLLLVELAQFHHGDSLVSRAVSKTVQRADEITELLMCYQWRTGKKDLTGMSNQLRKGLAEAFNHFDEYQFAKYNRTDRKVTLRDALLLVHPKPKDEAQEKIFKKILNDDLERPYTWETELSKAGKQQFLSEEERDSVMRATWQELIGSGHLGYMAMLRNLRNMTKYCIDEDSKVKVCQRLSSPEAVRKSKQLPFRYLSAYLQLVNDKDAKVRVRYPSRLDLRARIVENILQQKKAQISYKVKMLKQGFHVVKKRKSSRYTSPYVLAQNLKNKGMGMRESTPPKYHHYYWVRKEHRVDTLPEKDALKLQKLEKMLINIGKRLKALQPWIEREELWFNRSMEKACEEERNKLKANNNGRRRMRLKEAWITMQQYLTPKLNALENKELGISRQQYLAPMLYALEKAAIETAANIPGFDESTRVLLASDTSGSMCCPVSKNSSVICLHIGLLLSMLMKHRCPQAVTGMFGSFWREYNMPSTNILQNTIDMINHSGEVGYATNGYMVIDWLIEKGKVMDKVMLFTDCQLWNNCWNDANLAQSWNRYKKIAPDAKLYLFDLDGYGQSPISMERDDVFCIAGWSDKVFDILAALERGNSAIDEIRRIVV